MIVDVESLGWQQNQFEDVTLGSGKLWLVCDSTKWFIDKLWKYSFVAALVVGLNIHAKAIWPYSLTFYSNISK